MVKDEKKEGKIIIMGGMCSKQSGEGRRGNGGKESSVRRLLDARKSHRKKRCIGFDGAEMVPMWTNVVAPRGSLMQRCLEVICRDVGNVVDARKLQCLPSELVQLIVDHLILTERLDDSTVVVLSGSEFVELHLDGYHVDHGFSDLWIKMLFPVTLENLVLSRTCVDDFFISNLPMLPQLKKFHMDCCDAVTDASMVVLSRALLVIYKKKKKVSWNGVRMPLNDVYCAFRYAKFKRTESESLHVAYSHGIEADIGVGAFGEVVHGVLCEHGWREIFVVFDLPEGAQSRMLS